MSDKCDAKSKKFHLTFELILETTIQIEGKFSKNIANFFRFLTICDPKSDSKFWSYRSDHGWKMGFEFIRVHLFMSLFVK